MKFKDDYKDKIKRYVLEHNLCYHIDTMGCAMNENDSSKYAGILESMGFFYQKDQDKANLILFNTCSVRENAENTLFGRLGYLKNRRCTEKNVFLVVVGCMSQQKHVLEKIKKSYSYTDIVLGTHSMSDFPQKLYECIINKQKIREYVQEEDSILEQVPILFKDKNKASVSIIYGCNNFCTYCIVPYVRGRERSRTSEDILKDIQSLVENGYQEITLLGQNVNSYGKDLKTGETFAQLLRKIEKIQGIKILRFVSPHPKDFTDDVIDAISDSKIIAKQIHLPLQSGSSKILSAMNRKYTKEEFLTLINKIKIKVENVTFSTDIIVGFPGETEQDFLETLEVINTVKFDQVYMYIYSKRIGTKAATMQDNCSYEEKSLRLQRLKALFTDIVSENNERLIGKEFSILVEGKSKTNETLYTGRTNSNKIIVFQADEKDVGTMQTIKVVKNNVWYLTGEKR